MTWTPKQPLCPKTTLYLTIGWGGGGDHVTKVQCPDLFGDSPHPLPPPQLPSSQTKVIALNQPLKKQGWKERGGGEGWILGQIPLKHALLRKTGLFQSEAALLVQIFPWETKFMNNALWSPRGARAGERTRTAGATGNIQKQLICYCTSKIIRSNLVYVTLYLKMCTFFGRSC